MDIQKIKENIVTIRTSLKKYHQEIKALLAKPDVASWRNLDFKKHSADLNTLGLPVADIASSVTVCQQLAKKFITEARALANELGNLQADLIGKVDEAQVTAANQKIRSTNDRITEIFMLFRSKALHLIEARKQFSNQLRLKNLLKLAAKNVKHKDSFRDGLEVFEFFFQDQKQKKTKHSVESFRITEEKLAIRFKSVEASSLPNLAEEIVHHQILIALHTLTQTSALRQAVAARFEPEMATKHLLNQKIYKLQEIPSLDTVMLEIAKVKESLAEFIRNLASKKSVLELIHKLPETYEQLNILHLTIKNNLLPQMAAEISVSSPLNPITAAETNSKKFFSGIKGIMRSFKLVYSSMKGHEVPNSQEFQLILEKAITTCRYYYGTSSDDIKKLSLLIDKLLIDYDRPFPYQPLFKIVKATIANYGKEVEKYIYTFNIDDKHRSIKEANIPRTLGKLTDDIESNSENFTKLVSGMI